jgi:hypothetical protein
MPILEPFMFTLGLWRLTLDPWFILSPRRLTLFFFNIQAYPFSV